jgi:hypothetical protein
MSYKNSDEKYKAFPKTPRHKTGTKWHKNSVPKCFVCATATIPSSASEFAWRMRKRRPAATGDSVHIIDYDQIDDWSPWFGDTVSSVAPKALLASLKASNPQYLEDARDHLLHGIDQAKLVQHLDGQLVGCEVRVYHGTRVTADEARDIKKTGLRPLCLVDRGDALTAIFGQHPDWPARAGLLGEQLHRFGVGWEKGGAGRREDGCVHVCLSRAGLLHGCNHYLTHGAEVDQHIASELFPDGTGLELLTRHRSAKLVSFRAPFPDAAAATNPYGFRANEIPNLLRMLITAWAYKVAKPDFALASERDTAALKFRGPIAAERIERIEDIDDAILVPRLR